jgi:hypothetical protein
MNFKLNNLQTLIHGMTSIYRSKRPDYGKIISSRSSWALDNTDVDFRKELEFTISQIDEKLFVFSVINKFLKQMSITSSESKK